MTRKSPREIERALDDLEEKATGGPGFALIGTEDSQLPTREDVEERHTDALDGTTFLFLPDAVTDEWTRMDEDVDGDADAD